MRQTLAILTLGLAMSTTSATAQEPEWQLLAIDGKRVQISASLVVSDGGLRGKAPCNLWAAANRATLPALSILGIRATRMACADLADEQMFFDTLTQMDRLDQTGASLVLTGPDGRSMEFVTDRTNSLNSCKTCPADD
jgi:heat shock protein HslJ